MPVFIDTKTCIGCGQCITACSKRAITLEGGKAVINSKFCVLCGHCFAICPKQAVHMMGYEPEDISTDMSKLIDCIAMRRTIRRYKQQQVPKELLEEIINITKYAPSASNKRPIHFLVIGKQTMKKLLPLVVKAQCIDTEDNFYEVFRGAPHIIICYAPADLKYSAEEDSAIWLTELELYAQQHGLGTFWAGRLESGLEEGGAELLGLAGMKICCCMGIGYPDITYKRPAARADLDNIRFID